MIKPLLLHLHILAGIAAAGLVLWLLHDLWFVVLAVIIILALIAVISWRWGK